MVFPGPAIRGTELIPSKPRFGDPYGPSYAIPGRPFLLVIDTSPFERV